MNQGYRREIKVPNFATTFGFMLFKVRLTGDVCFAVHGILHARILLEILHHACTLSNNSPLASYSPACAIIRNCAGEVT